MTRKKHGAREAGQQSRVLVCALAALAPLGCQKDEIHRYRVPKSETFQQDALHDENGVQRMLAAILPHGERTWFFKLVGPAQQVEEHKDEFDRFVRSVHFTDKTDVPVEWTIPDNWRREPGAGPRFAAFRVGAKDSSLELTVTPLGREAGSLLANVNRWRGQLGLKPITEADLSQVSKELEVDGAKATLVDMTGARKPPKSPPFASGRGPFLEEAGGLRRPSLSYTTPNGWKEVLASGLRVAAFDITNGNQSAEVTVIPFPGGAGGLLENVNRWRNQIGLGPTNEEQLRQEVRHIEVDATAASYVDLVGPESPGRRRILGVMVVRGAHTWFFKMTGPADLVASQKPAFEALLRSVNFERRGGSNDG